MTRTKGDPNPFGTTNRTSVRDAGSILDAAGGPDRLVVGVSGTRGSGKTGFLADVAGRYRAAGIPVVAVPSAVPSPTDRIALVVDDAHLLPDAELGACLVALTDPRVDLVVGFRPGTRSAVMRALTTALERIHPVALLGVLDRDAIAGEIAAITGTLPSLRWVEEVEDATAGSRWLVRRVAQANADPDVRGEMLEPRIGRALEELGDDLGLVDDDVRELVLALAAGFDLGGPLPGSLEHRHLDELVQAAQAEGLLTADGRLIPLVRDALLDATPGYRLRALQRSLVDVYERDGAPLIDVARGLARSGLRDRRVADALERAADDLLLTRPELARDLYDEALAAGGDPLATSARRAQALAVTGDVARAARIIDDLLTRPAPCDAVRAVDVGTALWAHRGMLARGADGYRWLGAGPQPASGPLAILTLLATGDVEGATAAAGVRATAIPTMAQTAGAHAERGIRASLDGAGGAALSELLRASDALTASRMVVPVPETPAALAALVALHSGDAGTALDVLGAARRTDQGGPLARTRLLLLTAWAQMHLDRLGDARRTIAVAVAADPHPGGRDEFVLRALEVGLARRADDTVALGRAWRATRDVLLRVGVDLFTLLPLAELVIAAARVRETERVAAPLADAWRLLERLGDPPLWSAHLHWAKVQEAIITNSPALIAPHAAALVRAGAVSRTAAILADAGRCWVAVLGGGFDVADVEHAARGLASIGLVWDGGRLVGHAAAHAENRRDQSRLLASARALTPHAAEPTLEPAARPTADDAAQPPTEPIGVGSGLSARERQVARMVLEGKSYREIGEAIFISPRTVEHHMARMRQRLDADTRSQLLSALRDALEPAGHGARIPSTP